MRVFERMLFAGFAASLVFGSAHLPRSAYSEALALNDPDVAVLANSGRECATSANRISPTEPVMGAKAVPLRLRLASCPLV